MKYKVGQKVVYVENDASLMDEALRITMSIYVGKTGIIRTLIPGKPVGFYFVEFESPNRTWALFEEQIKPSRKEKLERILKNGFL